MKCVIFIFRKRSIPIIRADSGSGSTTNLIILYYTFRKKKSKRII